MKRLLFILALLVTVGTIQAQTSKDYSDYINSSLKLDIKTVVYNALNLSQTETNKFDPIFNKYLKDAGKVYMDKLNLYGQYLDVANQSAPSLDVLNKMNKDLFKYDMKQLKLEKSFYKRFTKAIGVDKASEFFFVLRGIQNQAEYDRLNSLLQ